MCVQEVVPGAVHLTPSQPSPPTHPYLLSPAPYSRVPHITEFGVEETAHGMDSAEGIIFLPSFNYQVHVEIDDLQDNIY